MVAVGEGVGLDRCDGVADGVGVLDGLPPCAPSGLGAFFTWLSAAGANSATAGGEDWLASSATTPRVNVAATAMAVNTTPGPLIGRREMGTGASISHITPRHCRRIATCNVRMTDSRIGAPDAQGGIDGGPEHPDGARPGERPARAPLRRDVQPARPHQLP